MKNENINFLEVKKSKFYGYLFKINSVFEINNIIDTLKKENKNAKHIVYAYKLESNEKNYSDKEPNGCTRGLLDIIKINNLDGSLLVVVRYYGGILLGSGLLTRTYTKIASITIKKQF